MQMVLERLTRRLERGREKKKVSGPEVSLRIAVETCRQLVDDATPILRLVGRRGEQFLEQKNIFEEKKYYISQLVHHPRDLSPISAPFSQVAASLFGQAVPVSPTQEPLSASVNILLPAYTVASRRDGSRLLFTLLWPAHSTRCLPVSLPTVSVHYQHRPGNDHESIPNPRKIFQRILH
ncbi:hypothetical protein K0M31_001511 [Melipona bicolor]|uniref:Uncharacterized protein n=1 Tax=Melipona bicolor TaxID=60889 RepID=A0AA40KXW5_9HYME|nr:hypothetical protein K0M31_001511 [Melipona bicolor]